ncbi:hypothetical protein ARMSODRAFT_1023780 [Armillaria solidipes]|uniref:Ribonuclease H1 N-terminal domain-containing protein n=1 Tax=Armillaria solidipes TaxID=1076256 RepID=A0A2H3BC17_9AGAR|nr:hypothetical protein ARMSODRAFT_1023780 [Armillaria solidipes]
MSIPPSSPSSFCPSSRASSRPPSCARNADPHMNLNTRLGSNIKNVVEEEDNAYVAVTTTTMTTFLRSPSRGPTSQFQPPSLAAPFTPHKLRNIKREGTPFSPLSPTKSAPAFETPGKKPVSGLGGGPPPTTDAVPTPAELHHRIPHPDRLASPPDVYPPPKSWYVVTVGQEVGIFHSWLDVATRIRGVPGPVHKACRMYSEALAEYHHQFEDTTIQIVLVPGSKWAKEVVAEEKLAKEITEQEELAMQQEYDQFLYDEEAERAVCEVEGYAATDKAYMEVLKSYGIV